MGCKHFDAVAGHDVDHALDVELGIIDRMTQIVDNLDCQNFACDSGVAGEYVAVDTDADIDCLGRKTTVVGVVASGPSFFVDEKWADVVAVGVVKFLAVETDAAECVELVGHAAGEIDGDVAPWCRLCVAYIAILERDCRGAAGKGKH